MRLRGRMANALAVLVAGVFLVIAASSVSSDEDRPETCIRKHPWWLMGSKYPCTRAEFEAQQANDHQHP